MEIHVSHPAVVDDLIAAFREGDCVAVRSGMRAFVVHHLRAADEREARVEITFFLRAWEQQHAGVEATLVS
jgi:hypothetical protein